MDGTKWRQEGVDMNRTGQNGDKNVNLPGNKQGGNRAVGTWEDSSCWVFHKTSWGGGRRERPGEREGERGLGERKEREMLSGGQLKLY